MTPNPTHTSPGRVTRPATQTTLFPLSLIRRMNMKLQTKTLLAALTTTAAMATGSANAATVLVDLSTAAVVTNPASDGKYWTSFGTGSDETISTNDLIDSNNVATPWDLEITTDSVQAGGTSGAGFGGTGINGQAGGDPFDEANAITDGIFANNNSNGTAVITLTGLLGSTSYDLSAIGGRASNGKDGLITILSGTSGSSSYSLLNNGTVLDFTVTSTAGGEISFGFEKGEAGDSGGSTFNAFSVTGDVPEPGSLALLGLGSMLVASRRRRG